MVIFFLQLDPMLFGVFGPKVAKESPCRHQLVNSKIVHFCLITIPRYMGSREEGSHYIRILSWKDHLGMAAFQGCVQCSYFLQYFYRTQVYLGSNLWVQVSVTPRPCADLTDVTLVDEDTKSILTDNANRAIQGNQAMHVT